MRLLLQAYVTMDWTMSSAVTPCGLLISSCWGNKHVCGCGGCDYVGLSGCGGCDCVGLNGCGVCYYVRLSGCGGCEGWYVCSIAA